MRKTPLLLGAFALLLIISSALIVMSYNQVSTLQNNISENSKVIGWLDTALNLTQLTVKLQPPQQSQYLKSIDESNQQEETTKIYLVSTTVGYSYDPYPWPLNDVLRNNLIVSTDNGSIRLPDFGWNYLPGNYSFYTGGEIPVLMIGVTVRNDYTPFDAGNGNDPSMPIGNRTGNFLSSINLAVRIYSQDGSLIQIKYADNIPTPEPSSTTKKGGTAFLLGSGQTKQVIFYLSTSGIDLADGNYCKIYVSSLSAY